MAIRAERIEDIMGDSPVGLQVNTRLNDLVGKLGQEAMHELFAAYSLETELSDARRVFDGPNLGLMGFTAPNLKGSVTLVVPSEVSFATQAGSDPLDWTGELTNQYLGRLKNKLISYGVLLDLATPLVVSGLEVSLPGPEASDSSCVGCNTEVGPVHAVISVRTGPGFALLDEPLPSGRVPSEGECLLF